MKMQIEDAYVPQRGVVTNRVESWIETTLMSHGLDRTGERHRAGSGSDHGPMLENAYRRLVADVAARLGVNPLDFEDEFRHVPISTRARGVVTRTVAKWLETHHEDDLPHQQTRRVESTDESVITQLTRLYGGTWRYQGPVNTLCMWIRSEDDMIVYTNVEGRGVIRCDHTTIPGKILGMDGKLYEPPLAQFLLQQR